MSQYIELTADNVVHEANKLGNLSLGDYIDYHIDVDSTLSFLLQQVNYGPQPFCGYNHIDVVHYIDKDGVPLKRVIVCGPSCLPNGGELPGYGRLPSWQKTMQGNYLPFNENEYAQLVESIDSANIGDAFTVCLTLYSDVQASRLQEKIKPLCNKKLAYADIWLHGICYRYYVLSGLDE